MDAVAIERLSGLCRLWGAVKFLHPSLAYRAVDWDAALITAIPRILEATSTDDYHQALDHLLATLDDPLTGMHTLAPPAGAARAGGPAHRDTDQAEPRLRWTEDRAALLVARDLRAVAWPAHAGVLGRLLTEAAGATALVLDLRGAWPALCAVLADHLGAFLGRDVQLRSDPRHPGAHLRSARLSAWHCLARRAAAHETTGRGSAPPASAGQRDDARLVWLRPVDAGHDQVALHGPCGGADQ